MKKILLILFLVASWPSFSQTWRQYYDVPNINSRFGEAIPYGTKVQLRDSVADYFITHMMNATDSMATVFRHGWYVKFGGAGSGLPDDSLAWYHVGNRTMQRYPDDTVIFNNNVKFKGLTGKFEIFDTNPPYTYNTGLWFSAHPANSYAYITSFGPSGFGGTAKNTLLMSPYTSANVFGFESDHFGSFAYQLDEYGFYPTDYTTLGTYNQYLGIPASHWKRSYIDTIDVTVLKVGNYNVSVTSNVSIPQTGTVQSVSTTSPLTGGTITTTGTLSIISDTLADWRIKQNKGSVAWGWGNHNGLYVPIATKANDSLVQPWKYLNGNTVQRGIGNIGVGTTSPQYSVDVPLGTIRGLQLDAGNVTPVQIGDTTVVSSWLWFVASTKNTGYFNFKTSQTSTTKNVMRITNSGKVGILTIDPRTELEVNGIITATGGTSTEWNSAYSWGNWASSKQTETSTSAILFPSWSGVKNYADSVSALKANTSHTQAISTITNLQDSITSHYSKTAVDNRLAGKQATGSYEVTTNKVTDSKRSTNAGKYYNAVTVNAQIDSVAGTKQASGSYEVTTNKVNVTGTSATKYASQNLVKTYADSVATLLARIESPTFTGTVGGVDIDITGNITADSAINPGIKAYGAVGSTENIYMSMGNTHTITRDASTTLTLIGGNSGTTYTLVFTHENSATAYTVAFSPAVKWSGGTALTFTNTANAVDIVVLKLIGTTWYASGSADFK